MRSSGAQDPAKKPKSVDAIDQASFKPKSATDYLAHVPEQSTRRMRRHEDLINTFAEYLEATGVKPISRHPRDPMSWPPLEDHPKPF